jgi:hypothetical protein
MKKPLYRWICTICGISDEAESPEMARLNIDLHVQVAHAASRTAVNPAGDTQEEDRGADA